MMRWAFVAMAGSFPLFWYTWKTRGEGWIASLFGIQLVLLGLRLLHWGYSMKEELSVIVRRKQICGNNKAPTTTGDPDLLGQPVAGVHSGCTGAHL